MEHLRGVVQRITYQNAENGYSVIKCALKGYNDLVTVVGSMPEVHVGSVLNMGGSWRIDPKYGRQFSMETFEGAACQWHAFSADRSGAETAAGHSVRH